MFFKCENFQKVGAFKIRGAMNAALSLADEEIKKGLATHSSGNHAQAIAYATKVLNTKAYIVMPENSPAVKVDAVRGYGAEIFFCEANLQAREDTMADVLQKTGATFIHPYDDDRIIAGQSTCAKELLEDVSDLDAIIAPVGGGGLLAGTLASTHYMSPKTEVYAGEPEGAADAVLSIKTGKIEKAPYIDTIADGLLTTLGVRNFKIIKKYVKDIFTVSDKEIIGALRLVYERLKIVIEPSAAVPLAVLLKHKEIFVNKRVGIIFSGGNIDLGIFKQII